MEQNTVTIAEAYYTAMSEKNLNSLEMYLHSNVQFSSPFAQLQGKETVLEAINKFMGLFKTLTIRATFGSKEQAMVVYDVDFSSPIGNIPTAALLTFQEKRITKIELFFDGRSF